jgi:hypothetical protein
MSNGIGIFDRLLKMPYAIYVLEKIVGVEKRQLSKKDVTLSYPNPFNPECYIPVGRMEDEAGRVKVKIYNILGQLVREIEISNLKSQISKSIYWDGKDSQGLEVPSGVYFYEVTGEDIRQMVVLK